MPKGNGQRKPLKQSRVEVTGERGREGRREGERERRREGGREGRKEGGREGKKEGGKLGGWSN